MKIPAVVLLLAAGLDAVLAKSKEVYFENGGKLPPLNPASVPVEGITAITWKHNGNLVTEWLKVGNDLTYYGDFKGRTELDTITGQLTIRAMKKADEGDFSVEVNYKVQSVVYSAKMVTNLREKNVEVVQRPLTCNRNSEQCTLSCLGNDTDLGPVEFFWKRGKQWKKSEEDSIVIINDEGTRLIKTFSCKIQNPVSEKESEPYENPFEPEAQDNTGLVVGIVFLVLLILGGVGLSVFAYIHPEKLAPCVPCIAGRPDQNHSGEPPEAGEKREMKPLNQPDPENSAVG